MKESPLLQVQAYDYLIDLIKQGTLQENTIYSLNQMAKEAGFSRTPFRDAVLRLEQERYLDILPSKGFILHKMTREDILETYEIRNAIEVFCFKQLSLHLDTERGKQYYTKLCTKVEAQKEILATSGSYEDFGRKDYEFHRSLVQYVNNASMLEIYRRFMYRIFWLNISSFSREGRMKETVTEHICFLDMLKKHDVDGLETMLNHHLTVAQDINLTLLEQ